MAETSSKPLKAILETIREPVDFALRQLQESDEERSMRWKCKICEYVKHRSRSHNAVIRVYDEAGNVIETHEHVGDFKEW